MTDALTTTAAILAAWLASCVALMQVMRWATSPEAVAVIDRLTR